MTDKTIVIDDLEMTDGQAWALAQLVKRLGWVEISNNAIDADEAHVMRCAVFRLQQALARHGFDPR